MKKVAVLLTCFNRKEKTLSCLKALFKVNRVVGISIDVFLLDDASSDGTSIAVKKFFPEVYITQGNGNLFWNRGMHTVWEFASQVKQYDYFLWLNDDTNLNQDALSLMFQIMALKKDHSIGVGAIHAVKDKNKTSYGGYRNDCLLDPNGEIQMCDEFNGNCVLIPMNVFSKLGNLDFYFRHSFGDIEYGRRAKKNGIKIWLTRAYVGECDRNSWPPAYLSKNISLKQRLKILYSPLGFNPVESFYLNRKYRTFLYAIIVFVKLHLNVFFPSIFKREI